MTREVEICNECHEDITYDVDSFGLTVCNFDCKCYKRPIKNIDAVLQKIKQEYEHELLQKWNELERNKKHNFRE
jgi:hypothetical protein